MEKIYITTPAYYPNDIPHIGHAYTTIASDILARWYRLKGNDVMFISGLDEHGEKIEKIAKEKGIKPKEFVNMMAKKFEKTWKLLNISYDEFIRTSQNKHIKVVNELFKKIYDNEDIYKGFYEGWYCTPCESYWTENQLINLRCPQCNREVNKLKEESYFFKLSKYQDKLLEFYKNNPDFISPEYRKKEIITRVKEGLKDLSISRKKIKWGIPLPADKKFTLYVWQDALAFYISVLGYPTGEFKRYWPPDIQLMAKEILWFHAVIQPALLMSAKILPLPKKEFAHGWLTINGQKMSKSLGNAIDPIFLSKKYSVDALRYYLMREIPFGQDGDFSEKALVNRLNSELADALGNLLSRTLTMIEKYNKGTIPKGEEDKLLSKQLNFKAITNYMENLEFHNALSEIFKYIDLCNKYINDNKPWELAKNKKEKELNNILFNMTESLRIIAEILYPFTPETSLKMHEQLGFKHRNTIDLRFGKAKSSGIKKGENLFKKIKEE